jgi:hypothetical protein
LKYFGRKPEGRAHFERLRLKWEVILKRTSKKGKVAQYVMNYNRKRIRDVGRRKDDMKTPSGKEQTICGP